MNAVAECGTPISPDSTTARAVWVPVPRSVSGAQPTRRPAVAAAETTARPSSTVVARGFSPYTCFPAARAASA